MNGPPWMIYEHSFKIRDVFWIKMSIYLHQSHHKRQKLVSAKSTVCFFKAWTYLTHSNTFITVFSTPFYYSSSRYLFFRIVIFLGRLRILLLKLLIRTCSHSARAPSYSVIATCLETSSLIWSKIEQSLSRLWPFLYPEFNHCFYTCLPAIKELRERVAMTTKENWPLDHLASL